MCMPLSAFQDSDKHIGPYEGAMVRTSHEIAADACGSLLDNAQAV